MARKRAVYLIKADSRYKIGYSKNIKSRLRNLDKQSPYELELVDLITRGNALKIESKLHEKFSDKNVKGEWFELKEEDIKYFRNYTPEGTLTDSKSNNQRDTKRIDSEEETSFFCDSLSGLSLKERGQRIVKVLDGVRKYEGKSIQEITEELDVDKELYESWINEGELPSLDSLDKIDEFLEG